MTFFEYVAVLVSIIVALGIAQILSGVARMIEKPEGQKVYWVHLLWAAWLFLYLIFFWWFEFQLARVEEWTFYAYGVLVLYATVLFLMSAILFPSRGHDGIDFEERFFQRRRWFFGLFILCLIINVPDTLLKGTDHLSDLGLGFWIYGISTLLMCLAGYYSTNRKVHGFIVVANLVFQVGFIGQLFFTIA
jgi:hypothetical protein